VLVVWEHVTPSDRMMPMPTTSVLMRVSDRRARQFWDEERLLSKLMSRDLPRDTLASVAETNSSGGAVAWDCVAVFRPGVRWGARFPIPDWSGRPVADVTEGLRRGLAAAEDTTRERAPR
jgi:hypothetical protein